MNEVDMASIGTFNFPNFLNMMLRKVDEINAEEEIREAFKVFDSNGDGFINRQELGYVMENLGQKMEKEEIEALINEIDIDGDGQINYEEFYMMENLGQKMEKEEIEALINELDIDGDGQINYE